jgi:hypothetical protein
LYRLNQGSVCNCLMFMGESDPVWNAKISWESSNY